MAAPARAGRDRALSRGIGRATEPRLPRRPRVSAHSGYGRSAAASDFLNIPRGRIVRSLDADAFHRRLFG